MIVRAGAVVLIVGLSFGVGILFLGAAGDYRWLAGELLEYHRREARPAWWWYFERCGLTPAELVEDAEAIGCLEADESAPAMPQKRR